VSSGDPPLVVSWLKDGQPLTPSLGVNVSALDPYSSLLSISSLDSRHSGDFTCVASNPAAEVRYTAKLQVKGNHPACLLPPITPHYTFRCFGTCVNWNPQVKVLLHLFCSFLYSLSRIVLLLLYCSLSMLFTFSSFMRVSSFKVPFVPVA
jgi:hypothetical protein